ncbi:hypothetical protein EVAR_103196_1 [Eumeta japonica]|uniref:Uncharacterized protein n=1 Tax=Eumeta variegata TaxID=151549 RepID=A0A4C1YFH4_EUMVA|nr:hypothetical protein EVAR_103196_1 [Eumeta japonica]
MFVGGNASRSGAALAILMHRRAATAPLEPSPGCVLVKMSVPDFVTVSVAALDDGPRPHWAGVRDVTS